MYNSGYGRGRTPLAYFGWTEPEEEEGLEGVLTAIKETDRANGTGGTKGRRWPVNGPCLVYVPAVKNGIWHHQLDVKATQRLSRGWTKEELQAFLSDVPRTKVYSDFDYPAFTARRTAQTK
jgi:hypothetical protein